MARTFEWQRLEVLWQVNPPPAGFGIYVTGLGPGGDAEATLMRTLVHARFTAKVTTSGGTQAPVDGWRRMSIRWVANFVDDGSQTIADPDSGDPSIVAVGWMQPRLAADPASGASYVIDWELADRMDSRARRAVALGVGKTSGVNLSFWVNDTDAWFRHTTPYNIVWSAWAYLETLWLDH